MKIDFFDTSCKEQENLEHQQFGICDDENGQKAYTNINDTNKWIATVNNEARKKLKLCQSLAYTVRVLGTMSEFGTLTELCLQR